MTARLLIHLDLDDKSRVTRALGNVSNFFREIPPEDAEVRVVVNSVAVQFFQKEKASDYAGKVQRLSGKGVRFLICSNSLRHLEIDRSALLDGCEVVPAGIVELVRLQQEGFAYVKP